MKHMPQSMSAFFRAFYYMKGGEFPANQNLTPLRPMPTAREAAEENARMPEYYVMRRDRGMPATMVAYMPSKEYIANCKWFTQAECDVYGQEYAASGWTGALHNYRHRRTAFPANIAEQLTFSGGPSMSPRSSLRANRTGAPTGSREAPREPERTGSRNSGECGWWIVPATGLRRNSQRL